ncbi:lysozyme inhibitor LprI family protein [Pseudomonas sp. LS1212]|uniref:lysozyme inhibitor LprI family protein n=1 Tax=Pseudomonas sp. LS1212 TaxID=2972478 RepID=UPI00215D56C8|nr:lysozyme inhibitor LprI family protein [Pseudomonas sp. LS1212]UVJ45622.1 lysozyme inhibitor LprI family protein [Pseudomonas sp. LS1212]
MYKALIVTSLIVFPLLGYSDGVDEGEGIVGKEKVDKIVDSCLRYDRIDDPGDVVACLQKEYSLSDAILNKQYHKMVSGLNFLLRTEPGERSERRMKTLRQSQRQWVSFRDKECEFLRAAEYHGPSGEINFYVCLVDQTYERANKLSEYINCYGRFRLVCPLAAG